MRQMRHEYEFINEVSERTSIGSTSKEWMVNTFTEEYKREIGDTICVTANAWVDTVLTEEVDFSFWTPTRESFIESHPIFSDLMARDTVVQDDFSEFTSLSEYSKEYKVATAETVTNHAIVSGRNRGDRRLIVHYMQPHAPYIGGAIREDRQLTEVEREPIHHLRRTGERDTVYGLYLDNLRYVLDSVGTLLRNINASKVAITADHGELFDEMGMSGHFAGVVHPKLKNVPWVETSAQNVDNLQPDVEPSEESVASIEDRLSDLGYL